MSLIRNSMRFGLILVCWFVPSGVALYFSNAAWKLHSDFYQWIEARPMQASVDFSKPGVYSVPFKQTCSSAHGESLWVVVDDPHVEPDRDGSYFQGLTGKMTIRGLAGEELFSSPFQGYYPRRWSGEVQLLSLHPFRTGEYTAELEILTGSHGLEGKALPVFAKYDLCGLEYMPVYVFVGIALVAGIISMISGVYLLRRFKPTSNPFG